MFPVYPSTVQREVDQQPEGGLWSGLAGWGLGWGSGAGGTAAREGAPERGDPEATGPGAHP